MSDFTRIGVSVGDSGRFFLRLDALASDADNSVMLLSVAGQQATIKRMRAYLASNAKGIMQQEGRTYVNLGKYKDGYTFHSTALAPYIWHMIAVARRPGLLPVLSEDTLWAELMSHRFTTPLRREWMPSILARMKADRHIRELDCYNCEAWLVDCDSEALDGHVTDGIQAQTFSVV